jgi:uncharacterized protein (TIGR02117 family)
MGGSFGVFLIHVNLFDGAAHQMDQRPKNQSVKATAGPITWRPGLAWQLLGFVVLIFGISPSLGAWECTGPNDECKSAYIVRDTWHAAIVLGRNNIPPNKLPELVHLPETEMIEFSWGDQDYFPDPDAGFFSALRAAFRSRGSVIHLVGFSGSVERYYPGALITELRLTSEAFARLLDFISATVARPSPTQLAEARPGLYANSRFYAATGTFSILRTCNTWVAEALRFSGLPIDPRFVITAGNLNNQLAELTAPK